MSPSAWHTPHDPREYTDPPVEADCDLCGLHRVYVAAEDWQDNEPYYCVACIGRIIGARHDLLDTKRADTAATVPALDTATGGRHA